MHLRLLGVVIDFAADVHVKAWVVGDRIFEFLNASGEERWTVADWKILLGRL